jgi:hypothetical protein
MGELADWIETNMGAMLAAQRKTAGSVHAS